jgi:hypothetical protein
MLNESLYNDLLDFAIRMKNVVGAPKGRDNDYDKIIEEPFDNIYNMYYDFDRLYDEE